MNLQEIAALPLPCSTPADLARIVRFFCYVATDGPEGCWLWQGGITNGYGKFDRWNAHVFAYTCLRGRIATGMTLDHLCRVRACVNPNHLEQVTRAENNQRMRKFHSRWGTPEACPHGHPRTEANLLVRKDGSKKCCPCEKERNRRRYRENPDRLKAIKIKMETEKPGSYREYMKAKGREWRQAHLERTRASAQKLRTVTTNHNNQP